MRTSPTEITYDEADHVGVITLNRPEARNALTFTTYAELEDAVRSTTARCLVITGADPAFCSGDDVKQIMQSAGERVASGLAADAPAHPGRRGAAHHRRAGDRRRQRRRGRLGHGAGGDGRPPGRVGAGPVRRAVREARPVLRRRRRRAAGPARRPGARRRAAASPAGSSTPTRRWRSAWSAGSCPTTSCCPTALELAAVDRGEPAARRAAHEAGPPPGARPDWTALGAWVSESLATCSRTAGPQGGRRRLPREARAEVRRTMSDARRRRCTPPTTCPSTAPSTPTATSSSRPTCGSATSSRSTATGRCGSCSTTTGSRSSRSAGSARCMSRRASRRRSAPWATPTSRAMQKDPERTYLREAPFGSMDPDERLELLDAEGIDAVVLYTTVGLLWEAELDDPELSQAYTRAYNRWICEFCADSPRLVPTAHLSLSRPEGGGRRARAGRRRGRQGRLRRAVHPRRSPARPSRQRPGVRRRPGPRRARSPSTRPSSRSGRRARAWARGRTCASSACSRRSPRPTVSATSSRRCSTTACSTASPQLKVIVLESGGGWIGYWLDRIDAVYGHTFIGTRVPLERQAERLLPRAGLDLVRSRRAHDPARWPSASAPTGSSGRRTSRTPTTPPSTSPTSRSWPPRSPTRATGGRSSATMPVPSSTSEPDVYDEILYEVDDPVATITLNRPDQLNAWTNRMGSEVRHAVGHRRGRPGGGGHRDHRRRPGVLRRRRHEDAHVDHRGRHPRARRGRAAAGPRVRRRDRPTSTASTPTCSAARSRSSPPSTAPVAGMAVPIALSCDLRFMADDAVMLTAFAQRGLIAEWGLSWLLPRLVGSGARDGPAHLVAQGHAAPRRPRWASSTRRSRPTRCSPTRQDYVARHGGALLARVDRDHEAPGVRAAPRRPRPGRAGEPPAHGGELRAGPT